MDLKPASPLYHLVTCKGVLAPHPQRGLVQRASPGPALLISSPMRTGNGQEQQTQTLLRQFQSTPTPQPVQTKASFPRDSSEISPGCSVWLCTLMTVTAAALTRKSLLGQLQGPEGGNPASGNLPHTIEFSGGGSAGRPRVPPRPVRIAIDQYNGVYWGLKILFDTKNVPPNIT